MQSTDQAHYGILRILYSIVKEDPYPLKYQVHPRELILRSLQDWSEIQSCLAILEKEGMILTRKVETLQISLTELGLYTCMHSGF